MTASLSIIPIITCWSNYCYYHNTTFLPLLSLSFTSPQVRRPLIGALYSYLITICPSNHGLEPLPPTIIPYHQLSLFGVPPPTIVPTISCLYLNLSSNCRLEPFPSTIVPTTWPPVASILSPSSNYYSYHHTTSYLYLEPLPPTVVRAVARICNGGVLLSSEQTI